MRIIYILIISFILFFVSGCSNNVNSGVVFTFDDTSIDEWYSFADELKSNGITATFFITRYHSITEAQKDKLKKLQSDGFEIGYHTVNHQNIDYLESHTIKEYLNDEIYPDLHMMRRDGFLVTSFAYPYGFNNDLLDTVLLKIFSHLRDVAEFQRYVREKPWSLKDLDSVFYPYSKKNKIISGLGIDNAFKVPLYMIHKGLKRAKNSNEIIVFYGHKIVNDVNGTSQISKGYLRKIIAMVTKLKLKSYRISDL